MPYALEAAQLTHIYNGRVRAIDGISFQVEDGEAFGFLGPNGAGKTTAIKIFTTLLRPTSGRALVSGCDVVTQSGQVRRLIGYLPQQLTSDDTLTGYENLLFFAKLYDVPRISREARIKEALNMVELSERAGDMVKEYSGGMKRRLEMASVLVSRPRILFLDEPTLGLDPQTRSCIWNYLGVLRREYGVTIFMTTHYMEEADKVCDRVGIINQGNLVACDKPSTLKNEVGGDIIIIGLTDPDPAILDKVGKLPYVVSADMSTGSLRLTVRNGGEAAPLILEDLRNAGSRASSILIEKPTLEDVFIKCTGRRLTDEVPSSMPTKAKGKARLASRLRR